MERGDPAFGRGARWSRGRVGNWSDLLHVKRLLPRSRHHSAGLRCRSGPSIRHVASEQRREHGRSCVSPDTAPRGAWDDVVCSEVSSPELWWGGAEKDAMASSDSPSWRRTPRFLDFSRSQDPVSPRHSRTSLPVISLAWQSGVMDWSPDLPLTIGPNFDRTLNAGCSLSWFSGFPCSRSEGREK